MYKADLSGGRLRALSAHSVSAREHRTLSTSERLPLCRRPEIARMWQWLPAVHVIPSSSLLSLPNPFGGGKRRMGSRAGGSWGAALRMLDFHSQMSSPNNHPVSLSWGPSLGISTSLD